MSGDEKDPFERLSQIVPPEPDPEKVKAVASMSARVFAERSKKPAAAKTSWFGTFLSGTGWLMPASGIAGALLVAVIAVPMMRDPAGQTFEPPLDMPAPATLERQRDAGSGEDTRMGSMPQRQPQGLPLDLREDAEIRTYDFDGLELMSRSVPEAFGLYLVDDGIETAFDQRVKDASEEIVLTDAFIQNRTSDDGDRILFVRSGYDDGVQQWDAFVDDGSGFALSGPLSMAVHDAGTRAEVLARLDEAGEN